MKADPVALQWKSGSQVLELDRVWLKKKARLHLACTWSCREKLHRKPCLPDAPFLSGLKFRGDQQRALNLAAARHCEFPLPSAVAVLPVVRSVELPPD
jgi:hypothetical protein